MADEFWTASRPRARERTSTARVPSRWVALVASLTLIASGCGGAVTPTSPASSATPPASNGVPPLEPVELTWWDESPDDPIMSTIEALISEFEGLHPGVEITTRHIENEQFFTALRTGFTSGDPPDIFQHEANNNLFQFVIPGEVEDISDWYAQPGVKERFLPGTTDAINYDGKYYGIPTTIHTGTQLYYNKKVLQQHGLDPTTFSSWDDYLAAFETLKQAGVTPIAYGNKFGWPGSQWFFAFLARWVGATKVNQLVARNCGYQWTDPDVVQAAQLYVDLAKNGYFSSGMASDDYPQATAAFFADRAGFFHTGSWFISDSVSSAPPGFVDNQLGVVKFPAIPGGKGLPTENVVAVLGGFSISKKAGADPAKRAAALAYLDFVSQVEQAQFYVKETQQINTVDGGITEQTANRFVLQMVAEQVEGNTGAVGYIEHQTPKAVGEDAIWQGSVGVLTGQLDAEGWMQNVESAAEANEPTLKLDPVCQ